MGVEGRPTMRRALIRHVSRHVGLFRFSMHGLLAALVVLLVTSPFIELLPRGRLLEAVLMTMTLVSAVQAVGNRRAVLWWASALVLPAIVGQWANHLWPGSVSPVLYLGSGVLFLAFIIVQLLRFILLAPRVNGEVLSAGVSAYLMLAILWARCYMLVGWVDPGAFAFSSAPASTPSILGATSFYFSFITLSTVGYGDIVPVSHVARMLAALEGVTGSLYMGILIARLVSLYSSEKISDGG